LGRLVEGLRDLASGQREMEGTASARLLLVISRKSGILDG
jgi:hypothetical protein